MKGDTLKKVSLVKKMWNKISGDKVSLNLEGEEVLTKFEMHVYTGCGSFVDQAREMAERIKVIDIIGTELEFDIEIDQEDKLLKIG
jgi:hypothetical protein